MSDDLLHVFSEEEQHQIASYLEQTYAGIFSKDAVQSHLSNYVGEVSQKWPLAVLEQHLAPGASVLDIGCGFGSFVLMARMRGYACYGIEPAQFEVEMARLRLSRLLPQDISEEIYRVGVADDLQTMNGEQFDAVTLWNVLEHIPHTEQVIKLCHSLLRPGGKLFIICPNYFSWRDEAHYHMPWSPLDFLFPSRFIQRIQATGKNPAYFIQGIVPVSNWGVLHLLWKERFTARTFSGLRLALHPSRTIMATRERLTALSPFVHSICLIATKDD